MRDDPSVIALVARAANGDQDAWNEIVERYAPLVWSVCARYRLNSQDTEDVGQTVWLLLVEHLGKLREPAALPGWLATTTHRECQRALTSARRTEDAAMRLDDFPSVVDAAVIEQEVMVAERNVAMRLALRELPPRCQQMLSMLISDPPRSYAEISAALQIPMGSIGPQRARCLERLRRSAVLARLGADELRASSARSNSAGGEKHA
jgi:RNA polymerase sigma factor (sigma-70 family)